MLYNEQNYIGQFGTILSVNKTREQMGAMRPFFHGPGHFVRCAMTKKNRNLAHGAIIAAMYVGLTHLQNLLLPGSATWAIQLRLSEALCVLALFTPAAVPGLTVGCFLFNLTYSAALPLDALVGSLATFLATQGMYWLRNWKLRGIPLGALLLPALWNGLLVGWELSLYIGGAFWLNALYVFLGEAIVLLVFGTGLYAALGRRGLDRRLFR